MILGIDPGITGAFAVLTDRGELFDYLCMPTKAEGQKRVIDVPAVVSWLADLEVERAVIERVHARSGQGVSSMFSFGRSYGVAEAILQCRGISFQRVLPRTWKAHHSLMLKGKDGSREKAQELWDDCIFDLKGKGQAVADAALLALYVLDKENGNGNA